MAFIRSFLALAAFAVLVQAAPADITPFSSNPFSVINRRKTDDDPLNLGYCMCYQVQEAGANVDETLTQAVCNHKFGSPAAYLQGDPNFACYSPDFGATDDTAKAWQAGCRDESGRFCKYWAFCCDPAPSDVCVYITNDACPPTTDDPGDEPPRVVRRDEVRRL